MQSYSKHSIYNNSISISAQFVTYFYRIMLQNFLLDLPLSGCFFFFSAYYDFYLITFCSKKPCTGQSIGSVISYAAQYKDSPLLFQYFLRPAADFQCGSFHQHDGRNTYFLRSICIISSHLFCCNQKIHEIHLPVTLLFTATHFTA